MANEQSNARLSVGDRIVTTYTWLILKTRWIVLLLCIASALAAGYGAQKLTFSNNYRYFFGADNPQLKAFATQYIASHQ